MAINGLAGRIFARLERRKTDAAARFTASERAWFGYRRSVCESRADLFEGGSAAVIVFADCVAARNTAHLKDLRNFERNLRPE